MPDRDANVDLPAIESCGHTFQFLPSGAAALAELATLIRQARRSVRLEMYIYKADETGNVVRTALETAARNRARVRVLLDDFGSADLPGDYFDELKKLGGEVRRFNPSRALRAAFRNHRKLCVIDHRYAVVGGFNVGDEYNGDGINAGWRDLGMRIEGPVVEELEASFGRMYIGAQADTRALIMFMRGNEKRTPQFDRPALLAAGPGFQSELLRGRLYRDIHSANRVAIIAAYFTPPWRLRRAMRHAAKRGIVRVVLPGVSDVPVMRLAAHHLYEKMLRHRLEIFEYQPRVLHSKLVIVDDIVYVGSCNFDVRSLQLNFDFLIRIPNAELAAQARQLFMQDVALSAPITLPVWNADTSFWRRTVRTVAYWLATRFDPLLARRNWRSLR